MTVNPDTVHRLSESVQALFERRTRVAVSTDGKLYPCARFVSTYPEIDGKYCLGDVWRGWTDLEKRLELMAELERRTKCQNCKLAAFCTGGCPAVNLYTTGNLYEPSPMDCHITAVYVALLRRKGTKRHTDISRKGSEQVVIDVGRGA